MSCPWKFFAKKISRSSVFILQFAVFLVLSNTKNVYLILLLTNQRVTAVTNYGRQPSFIFSVCACTHMCVILCRRIRQFGRAPQIFFLGFFILLVFNRQKSFAFRVDEINRPAVPRRWLCRFPDYLTSERDVRTVQNAADRPQYRVPVKANGNLQYHINILIY